MDYDAIEVFGFWTLAITPVLVLVLAAIFMRQRPSRAAFLWYVALGLAGSVIWFRCAGVLLGQIYPPPFDPYFSSGRGLDLRGIGLIFGSWIGGVAGLLTIATVTIISVVRGHRRPETG